MTKNAEVNQNQLHVNNDDVDSLYDLKINEQREKLF